MEPVINNVAVIYHGKCLDGFSAAWAAKRYFIDCAGHDNVKFIEGFFGEDPPDLTNHDVFIVDFSYDRETLLKLKVQARSLVVLDHHKTAQAALEGLDFCTFDMARSGCRMTWDYFFPGQEPPAALKYIEDRDLWNFNYEGTSKVHAFVTSVPHTFDAWDKLMGTPEEELISNGTSVANYIETYCDKVSNEVIMREIDEFKVATLNVPYLNCSETGNLLLRKHSDVDYSLTWFIRKDGRAQFSYRSREGFDVSSIAASHGGGGHARAAGCDLSMEEAIGILYGAELSTRN